MTINFKYQKGMTLMELLVAGTISIIASTGMIILMASTLGSATHTIKMTGLSEEMRTSMQVITRELRRANYHSTYATCFGDADCRSTLSLGSVVQPVTIDGGSGGSCVYFWYDRPQETERPVDEEHVAAFRRTTDEFGRGSIEMWVRDPTETPEDPDYDYCSNEDNWQPITDPEIYDITNFAVTNDESFTLALNSVGGNLAVDRIGVTMTGILLSDASLPAWMQSGTSLTLTDFIRVRNDITSL